MSTALQKGSGWTGSQDIEVAGSTTQLQHFTASLTLLSSLHISFQSLAKLFNRGNTAPK